MGINIMDLTISKPLCTTLDKTCFFEPHKLTETELDYFYSRVNFCVLTVYYEAKQA